MVLTGPRRSGKTTLLRTAFPSATYHLLEDPDLVARFRADPRAFVDGLRPPVILDEIQHVPEILAYLRTLVDRHPTDPALRLRRSMGRRAVICAVVHRGEGDQPALREGAVALSITEAAGMASGPSRQARAVTTGHRDS